MINILLAEDHHLVRNGLKMLLSAFPQINIVSEVGNGSDVIDMLAEHQNIHIVLADIHMPGMDGLEMIAITRVRFPAVKVIILSMQDDERYVARAFDIGCAAYLLKNISTDELVFALKHVYNGGKYLCAELSMRLMDNASLFSKPFEQIDLELSGREAEVLGLIAKGMTNIEISDQLFISKRTVEGHRQNLLEKSGAKNTAALIYFAFKRGLIA